MVQDYNFRGNIFSVFVDGRHMADQKNKPHRKKAATQMCGSLIYLATLDVYGLFRAMHFSSDIKQILRYSVLRPVP